MKIYDYFIEDEKKEHYVYVAYDINYEYNQYDGEIAKINIFEVYLKNHLFIKSFDTKQERDEYVQKYMKEHFYEKWSEFRINYDNSYWRNNKAKISYFNLSQKDFFWKDKYVIETSEFKCKDVSKYYVEILHLRKIDENSELVEKIVDEMYENL